MLIVLVEFMFKREATIQYGRCVYLRNYRFMLNKKPLVTNVTALEK